MSVVPPMGVPVLVWTHAQTEVVQPDVMSRSGWVGNLFRADLARLCALVGMSAFGRSRLLPPSKVSLPKIAWSEDWTFAGIPIEVIDGGRHGMRGSKLHPERHQVQRIGWLRAAVLGANDGIVSTASLIVGVAAAASSKGEILLAGVAGLVAGALSMAAGEYVSVSSQADTEAADLARESAELASDPEFEHRELAAIYRKRGLDEDTAGKVATQLMARDALAAHARDELSITHVTTARPFQAAWTSAVTFTTGACLPLIAALLSPVGQSMIVIVSATSLLFLATLGAIGARAGEAPVLKATLRVAFWGAAAMAVTAGIGKLVGTAV